MGVLHNLFPRSQEAIYPLYDGTTTKTIRLGVADGAGASGDGADGTTERW